jgi:hypothetical protein
MQGNSAYRYRYSTSCAIENVSPAAAARGGLAVIAAVVAANISAAAIRYIFIFSYSMLIVKTSPCGKVRADDRETYSIKRRVVTVRKGARR